MIIALKLLIWLVAIAANVYMDRKGRKPNYLQMFIIRGIAAFLHWCMFVSDPSQVPLLINLIIFQVTSFYIFFELGLNIVRGRPWLHYDYVEGDSGWIDRFWKNVYRKKKTHIYHHVFKLCVLILMCIAIYRVDALV